MLVKIALTKICAIKTVACAADMCMAWQWEHGHGSEYDENVVWYGDNLYPLPALPPDNSAEDREMIEMLRNCHSIIRSNIVRDWAPPTPPGAGWELHAKAWEEQNTRPYAVFRRQKTERHGYCGLARSRRNPDEDRDAW